MTKSNFLDQIYDILDENYYDNDSMKWLVGKCKSYYKKYKKQITFDVYKVEINEVQIDILKTAILETLKEILERFNEKRTKKKNYYFYFIIFVSYFLCFYKLANIFFIYLNSFRNCSFRN